MIDDSPLVSILIPTYNRKVVISDTLDCAFNQTYKNLQIVVTDNCSTDGTYELITALSLHHNNVEIYQNSQNIGPVLNWKRGLEYCKGAYTKILFSDDLIDNNYIEETIQYFNDEVGFVYSKTHLFGGLNCLLYSLPQTGRYLTRNFLYHHLADDGVALPVSPGCAIFRTADLKKNLIPEIDNQYGIKFQDTGAGNDALIYWLTCLQYPKFVYTDNTQAHFRHHEGSISVNGSGVLAFNYQLAKKIFIETYLNDPNLLKLKM